MGLVTRKGPGTRDTLTPPPREHTHACENITFPQLLLRAVIIKDFKQIDLVSSKTYLCMYQLMSTQVILSVYCLSHLLFIILASLDTLASAIQLNLTVYEEEKEKQNTHKVYTKEDFNVVNRFESKL